MSVGTIGCDQQNNNRDCGLFFIANASELALKEDPGTVRCVSRDRQCFQVYIALQSFSMIIKFNRQICYTNQYPTPSNFT